MFEDIALVRPTIFAATPRFYGIIYDQYQQMVKELSAKYSLEEARIPVSGVKVCGDGVCVYVCAFMRACVCVCACMFCGRSVFVILYAAVYGKVKAVLKVIFLMKIYFVPGDQWYVSDVTVVTSI